MQGQKAFEEKLFTNFQLSERVPLDNFYRILKNTLDLLRRLLSSTMALKVSQALTPLCSSNLYW
jgi:hypothetical protein